MAEPHGSAAPFRSTATLSVVLGLGATAGIVAFYALPASTELKEAPRSRAFEIDGRDAFPPVTKPVEGSGPRVASSGKIEVASDDSTSRQTYSVPAPRLEALADVEPLPQGPELFGSATPIATGSIRLVVDTYDATAAPTAGTPPIANESVEGGNETLNAPEQTALPPALAATEAPASADDGGAMVSVFPATPALDASRKKLASFPEATGWVTELDAQFADLATIDDWSDPRIAQTCVALAALTDRARTMAFEVQDPVAALGIQELGYDIERRVDLWSQVHATTLARAALTNEISLTESVWEIGASLAQHPERDVWRKFLLIEDLETALKTDASMELRTKAEGAIFGRFRHAALTPEQQAYLAQPEFERFLTALTIWSLGPNPILRVPAELERFETTRSQSDGGRLARISRALRASGNPAYAPIAESLERHYRNANLRVSVGKSFAARFVPQPQVTELPVREPIRGAWVSGRSETLTRLGIDFVPAEGELKFNLTVQGEVASATTASVGPARLFNDGNAWFTGAKPLMIKPDAFEKDPTSVQVRSRSSLRGFRTDYDGVPVIGSIVRNQVEQRVEEERALADRETSGRVAARIESYVDAEVERRIADAETRFRDKALSPLQQMGVDLTAIELETSADRAVARYRLAHPEQLAAYTPRPQALAVSEISVQLHESAFNNVVAQANLFGREMLLTEALERIRGAMGAPDGAPMDVPEGVSIRLVDRDGARVRFEDDQVAIELRVKRIAQDGETLFRNFMVRARYRPVVEGLQVKLVRTGVIELSGDRLDFRNQVALRAIFSKVFSENRALTLLKDEHLDDPRVQGLAVGQIVMNQGWLGVSLVPGITRLPTQLAPGPDQPTLR